MDYVRDVNSGRISAVTTTVGGSTTTVAEQIEYLPQGPVSAPVDALTYGNGLTLTRSFDRAYRMTDLQVLGVLDRTMGYDSRGNIETITDNLDATRNQTLGYDALSRLTSAIGAHGNRVYDYDGVGNRLSLTVDGAVDSYGHDSASHRLLSITGPGSQSYGYDANGNVTTWGAYTLTYDPERNRLTEVSGPGFSASYTYSAEELRVRAGNLRTPIK